MIQEELQQFNQQVDTFAQLMGGKVLHTDLAAFTEVAQALDTYEDFRVGVLVPLYNEDPDVVVRMFSADLVHCALEAGRLQPDQRDPRGCVLMAIHKAKGKESGGVLLVEGQYQGTFFCDTDTETQRAASRRLLRCGITRARRQIVIFQPQDVPAHVAAADASVSA